MLQALSSPTMATQNIQTNTLGSDRGNPSLSSLRSTVDTRGLLSLDDYHGEKEKLANWKRCLYSMFEAINPLWAEACRVIEGSPKRKITMAELPVEQQQMSREISRFLISKCKGDAATCVMTADEGNGFQSWRLLCDHKMPNSATIEFNSLMAQHSAATTQDFV